MSSIYHPERPCSNCSLCGRYNPPYLHYGAWGDAEREYLKKHWDNEPDHDSCICKAHYKEAKRTHPPGFIPQWKKLVMPTKHLTDRPHCMFPYCLSDSKLITPSTSLSELQDTLHVSSNHQQNFLCKKHYSQLYNQLNIPRSCASCGARAKTGTCFTRHSPNPFLVNQVLHPHAESNDSELLSDDDNICLSCYKNHLAIVKSLEEREKNNLQHLITIWEGTTLTNRLSKAILDTVLYVARELLNQRAMMLPDVSNFFLKEYLRSTPDSECILEGKEGTIKFTSKWLLIQLQMHLHLHMEHTCIHKKFGTLLYRKGGDLLISLSWALGRSSTCNNPEEPSYIHTTDTAIKTLRAAGDLVNNLIHAEISKTCDDDWLSDPECLNIDEHISSINPQLWHFLELMTRSTRERHGISCEENNEVKKLRRFFLFTQLSFCTNTQKPTLMHTLLADTVEMCGGSRKLLKILNRLGVTSSADTHDRFITEVACGQRDKTVWDTLPENVLSVCSADNFDMLESNAAVYCGDQSRSFHGTTIQIVTTNPECVYAEEPSLATNGENVPPTSQAAVISTPHKRHCTNSPSSSPHKLGKVGPKRPRTLEPRSLNDQLQHTSSSSQTSSEVTHTTNMTLQGFFEGPDEKLEREGLESKMFTYMFTKHKIASTQNLLRDFKDFYAQSTENSPKPSSVYYMELVNENPDSSDTMKYVSELLLQTSSIHQKGYIVLVGDGKTYEHLMEIKRLYSNSLEKLLIFPGDWHTLKNFQPVIMKIYYHAGLKQLAQISGFKGETLKSLEKCSNFKRTHHFLIQVWQSLYRGMLASFEKNSPELPSPSVLAKENTLSNTLKRLQAIYSDSDTIEQFHAYASKMAKSDDTWKFWYNFVTKDCSYYIQLFLAIRCRNWELRVSALKLMAPIFKAYDRTTYQKLIPNHLAELEKFPPFILNQLKKGFTVSIQGEMGHAVAIDEAHEMLINKDMKMAIVHPTQPYLQKTSLFLRYRIIAHRNLLISYFLAQKMVLQHLLKYSTAHLG